MSTQVHQLRAIWSRACARCALSPVECLFRTTEGFNLDRVLRHGTDRAGRERAMRWSERGYTGAPRRFEDVLFASTAAEIERVLAAGEGACALTKIPRTPDPLLLIYRAADLDPVHRSQYAFRWPARRRAALVGVMYVAALNGRGRA